MANLSELIRQKEQQTEEWKQRKADERDSLNEMNDAAALRVTESTAHSCTIWMYRRTTLVSARPMCCWRWNRTPR